MQITDGKLQKAIKCVVYGPEGIGKSTFASMAPNPLFCDVEDSTTHMDVRRLPKPTSCQMILDEINYVARNPHVCDTFIIDTADWVERLCRENVCAKNGKDGIEDFGYGKGFSYVFEDFGKILNAVDELIKRGINVIINAHAVMRKFEQPDEMGAYDRWELKLNNSPKCSTAGMLKEWADLVLFANYETFVVKNEAKKNRAQGGKRVMYTTHHPCWDAKNRFGLPEKLPFEFAQVAGLFMSKGAMQGDDKLHNGVVNGGGNGRPQVAPTVGAEGSGGNGRAQLAPTVSAEGSGGNGRPTHAALDTQVAPTVKQDGQQQEMPIITQEDEDLPFDVEIPAGVPRALADLMRNNAVSEKELRMVVSQRGYFPQDMPLNAYPADFINGVLVGAWDQVHAMVKENRKG